MKASPIAFHLSSNHRYTKLVPLSCRVETRLSIYSFQRIWLWKIYHTHALVSSAARALLSCSEADRVSFSSWSGLSCPQGCMTQQISAILSYIVTHILVFVLCFISRCYNQLKKKVFHFGGWLVKNKF
jgi:hypothetical protein